MSPPRGARWPALGSTAELRVADRSCLERALPAAQAAIVEIDRACSRFREDSELSRVNARAGRPVRVSTLMLDAVEVALRGAELSGGLLDPCLGRELELAGYDRDWELIEESSAVTAADEPPRLVARRRAAWREVEVDRAAGTVRVPAGAKLDLGATAKALAADRACVAAHARAGGGALVAVGGDVAVRGEAPSGGWQVHVTDDHRAGPRAPGQRIAIEGGGLATSSTAARRWRRGNEQMHHIIDPATGRPADTCWRTVSVAAVDCTDANMASTTALLLGDGAPAWLGARGLPARLVEHDGSVVVAAGWPEDAAVAAEAMG